MNLDCPLPHPELTPGVDVASLCAGGYNLLIGQRLDGSWHVARAHRNPRLRIRTQSVSGPTLEDALCNLQSSVSSVPASVLSVSKIEAIEGGSP
jgi:hypothetical protein